MCLFLCLMFVIAPILLTMYVIPYDMHCTSKLNTKYEVPDWCWSFLPNLYEHVQKVYWNAGFLEFLNRPNWQIEFLKALPTNLFALYILAKLISSTGIMHFLSFGIFQPNPVPSEGSEVSNYDVESCPFSIPLGWHFLLSFLMVLLGGNHEINT